MYRRTCTLAVGCLGLPCLSLWLAAAAPAAAVEADRPRYGPAIELCRLESKEINESSGLAASRRHSPLLWTHNDSGDEARIYCIDRDGRSVGTSTLRKTKVVDWEDMCSYVVDGRPKLLMADTGNNGWGRQDCALHIIDEPADPKDDLKRSEVQTLRLRYSTDPIDCEAVAVDPKSREILLIEKRFALSCRVFSVRLPGDSQDADVVAAPIARIRVPLVTAMDVSPDGRRAIVMTLGQAFEFARDPDETWASAFRRRPRTIDMPPRRQGEAICYDAEGRDLLLTSEMIPTPLFLVPAIVDGK